MNLTLDVLIYQLITCPSLFTFEECIVADARANHFIEAMHSTSTISELEISVKEPVNDHRHELGRRRIKM
jgi:hypothetical protein